MERTTWPRSVKSGSPPRVGIVVVNYNTEELIAQLLYSCFRHLDRPLIELVVIDNGSTDGSQELLSEMASAGLIHAILNSEQAYHGPGLNQGVSFLAERQLAVPATERVRYVWVLDSDCVIIRSGALTSAVELMTRTTSALVGQFVHDQYNAGDVMGLHSLLIDPLQVWQESIAPFEEDGAPSDALQRSVTAAGMLMTEFSFTRENYIVHLGRGTLAGIAERDEADNRYFEWSQEHRNPHFATEPEAPNLYATFRKDFQQTLPQVSGDALAGICLEMTAECS